jgi:hypothetical protein
VPVWSHTWLRRTYLGDAHSPLTQEALVDLRLRGRLILDTRRRVRD